MQYQKKAEIQLWQDFMGFTRLLAIQDFSMGARTEQVAKTSE
jgi:hypothetical protein